MLTAKKKISQRPIVQESPLMERYYETQSWIQENKKRVNTILGIIVVLGLGIWFYYNNTKANDEKAMTEFSKVFSYYDNGQYQLAINGIPEKNVTGLQSIVDNYGSTNAGNIAKFYLANAYYNTQNYDKALEYFSGVSVGNPMVENSAVAGEAACYEAKGDFKTAASKFEKAGMKGNDDVHSPEYLANAGRNYTKVGEKEKAIEIYKMIKKEYPKSPIAFSVDKELAALGVML